MSLILMSVMIFFIENIFHSFLPERRRIALPKRTREKIRIFALIADFLLLAALGVRFFLSRVEPLIILFLVNVEEITSIEEVRAVFESLRSSLSVMITPMDLSFVLVVFLAYFGAVIAPGILCAYIVFIQSPIPSLYRDTESSGSDKRPEIFRGGKLFLKLCHLLN